MEVPQNTLVPDDVFRAVAAVALNAISEDRQKGEAMLMTWENELAPGYIYSLLETVSRGVAINEVRAFLLHTMHHTRHRQPFFCRQRYVS